PDAAAPAPPWRAVPVRPVQLPGDLLPQLQDVPVDQEEPGQPVHLDQLELLLQPLHGPRPLALGIALAKLLDAMLAEDGVGVGPHPPARGPEGAPPSPG